MPVKHEDAGSNPAGRPNLVAWFNSRISVSHTEGIGAIPVATTKRKEVLHETQHETTHYVAPSSQGKGKAGQEQGKTGRWCNGSTPDF